MDGTCAIDPDAHYAPFFVINPGENIVTAMERHRRDTGHRGGLILVGINRPPLPRKATTVPNYSGRHAAKAAMLIGFLVSMAAMAVMA